MMIRENVKSILNELPEGVTLIAAAKTRTVEEVTEAVAAGITIIGENYVQEARFVFEVLGQTVSYHFIGHLQRNKVKAAIEIFDMIETVDSSRLAEEINKRCAQIRKTMPILIEVNSGREPQKFGVFPETVEKLATEIAPLENVKIMGLMTMGPFTDDPEEARPYFQTTRKCFDDLKTRPIPNMEMKYLSMGMTTTYRVAIEEGANMVRIGTKIFGERSR